MVAVSGGADSLALLHALAALRAETGLALHAATLDHGLRGEDGASDARFVVVTCAAWRIPVSAARADVAALARAEGLGMEEAARTARYAFLADVARTAGAARVATAHTADDQAETVLMHVLRGSGLGGLAGMRPAAPLPDAPALELVRPLLAVTRAEVDEYVRAHGLAPREDATNRDPRFLRNRLRHEWLPLLRQFNPRLTRALAQLADVAAADDDFLDAALRAQVIAPHVTREPDAIMLPRAVFAALHPALRRRFVAWAARTLSEERDPSAYVHVVAAVRLGVEGQVGAHAVLPGGLRLRVDYETLVVERADRAPDLTGFLLPAEADVPVTAPGETATPLGWRLLAAVEPASLPGPLAAIRVPEGGSLALRTRRPGDRFAPPGLGGHTTSLKEWMIDRKLPRALRAHIPLLTVGGAIAALLVDGRWIVAESFRPGAGDGWPLYVAPLP